MVNPFVVKPIVKVNDPLPKPTPPNISARRLLISLPVGDRRPPPPFNNSSFNHLPSNSQKESFWREAKTLTFDSTFRDLISPNY